MAKFLVGFRSALIAVAVLAAGPAAAGPSILVDLDDGRVLDQDEALRPWFPASLTKLMTTYVVFQAIKAGEIDFDSPIEMTARAAQEPPSKMGYPVGSLLRVDNAIRILMVRSANDVSTAIAENVGGSVDGFVARMNAEARRLGMTGTRYANAHGLHSDRQYTTARDQALLAMAIRRDFPEHAHFFSLEALSSGGNTMPNHNDLIARFVGADGMKTGYTCPSGFNLTATATRGDRTMLAVVLGAFSPDERADTAADLLARGFGIDKADAPLVWSLEAEEAVPEAAPNMRPIVCTEEAHKKRMERRGDEGRPVYFSPHIAELTREREAVEIGLGGTEGPVMRRFANVPLPKFRPDRGGVERIVPDEASEASSVPTGEAEPAAASPASGEPVPPIPLARPDRRDETRAAVEGG
ncbi:MAG: D-alanyl-D-alanine carboxypeptidase family protein [Rhizobiaceae bacterium]